MFGGPLQAVEATQDMCVISRHPECRQRKIEMTLNETLSHGVGSVRKLTCKMVKIKYTGSTCTPLNERENINELPS